MQQRDMGDTDAGITALVFNGISYRVDAVIESVNMREMSKRFEDDEAAAYGEVCQYMQKRFEMPDLPSATCARKFMEAVSDILEELKKSTLTNAESPTTTTLTPADGAQENEKPIF